jgi:hypothetical protein
VTQRELSQEEIFGVTRRRDQDRYGYDDHTWAEIHRMARLALPHGSTLKRATLGEDFGGTDAHYIVNHCCAMQIRARFDQPIYSADKDVTFRATEPAMIAAGTYAPLALFLWFQDGYAEAGKLIDIYRMAERLDPPLDDASRFHDYGRRGRFYTVAIWELVKTGALLMQGGRDRWAPDRLGGERDTVRILKQAAAK